MSRMPRIDAMLKRSIDKTVAAISDNVFDYAYFRRMVIAGLLSDGYEYIELSNTEDWLSCLDRRHYKWRTIDLYVQFSLLKTTEL